MLDERLEAANDAGGPGADARPCHVVLVGNFPPRRCGIATFTRDVYESVIGADPRTRCDVVAVSDGAAVYDYPSAVTHQIRQDDIEDYARAAQAIAASKPDMLCLQHEFGIFGGPSGEHVLTLLYGAPCPVVTTLHTVLPNPTSSQRRVMAALIARSARLIVMAEKGKQLLMANYDVAAAKIVVVPHGAPDHPFVDSEGFKADLGLDGSEVLLTFGLLSPNKGIEAVIHAMPAIRAKRPNATYVVLGATHPHLIASEGEAYRERLYDLADECGVRDAVKFINQYVDHETLVNYLAAADIYVTPYLNEAQITSGTLSYAVALGKPVISTPYWHATELLANGVGFLVDFNDSEAFAANAIRLLSDDPLRTQVRRAAYAVGRAMIWSRVAERYLAIFSRVRAQPPVRARQSFSLPQPSVLGIAQMSDHCGILQHSSYGVADRHHGYCVDDNARGLMVMNRLEAMGRAGVGEHLTRSYAAFINHAWNPARGRFRNFMSYDRHWLEELGSEDSLGRSFHALGDTAEHTSHTDLKYWAESLAQAVMPYLGTITAPRARAFVSLGLKSLLVARPDFPNAATLLATFAADLVERLRSHRQPGWIWFERYIAYDNARVPEALIQAGMLLRRPAIVDAGLDALSWLCALQSAPNGLFRAIGSVGIGHRVVVAPPFDQQPLEAAATIDACAAAFDATGDEDWIREARRAYDWFLGGNDTGASLADPARGLCYDGLTPERINRNHGAESILSFQLATCAMHALSRAARPSSASIRAARG